MTFRQRREEWVGYAGQNKNPPNSEAGRNSSSDARLGGQTELASEIPEERSLRRFAEPNSLLRSF